MLAASLGAPSVLAQGSAQRDASASLLAFPGASAYRTPDADANGRYESIDVDINLNLLAAGSYVIVGELQSMNGALVANRPAFQSMLFSSADVSGAAGPRTITLRFSGEQIRQSRTDGPYQLVLYANNETGDAGAGTIITPAFRWLDFGERKAHPQPANGFAVPARPRPSGQPFDISSRRL